MAGTEPEVRQPAGDPSPGTPVRPVCLRTGVSLAGAAWPEDPLERAAAVALAGHRSPTPEGRGELRLRTEELRRLLVDDPDSRVRSVVLSALRRSGSMSPADWARAASDPAPAVRRRAAELAAALRDAPSYARLLGLLADPDPSVAESAAFALGELGELTRSGGGVEALVEAARRHRDPLVRESAVAALGALGDPAGLGAILAACSDRPAVRRRAVLALAPFEGEEVEAAIARAREDRDWQVRDAAEDLGG